MITTRKSRGCIESLLDPFIPDCVFFSIITVEIVATLPRSPHRWLALRVLSPFRSPRRGETRLLAPIWWLSYRKRAPALSEWQLIIDSEFYLPCIFFTCKTIHCVRCETSQTFPSLSLRFLATLHRHLTMARATRASLRSC